MEDREKNPAAVALGKLGGNAEYTRPRGLAGVSKKKREEIAKAGVAARRKNAKAKAKKKAKE